MAATSTHAQTIPRDTTKRDSASVATDSLRARLTKLERDLAILRGQLADESKIAARTRSRIGLIFTARIQMNMFANTERTNSVDVPQLLLAPPTSVNPNSNPGTRTFGLSMRQSRVGAVVSVDSVFGGRFEGDFDLDFFGGVSNGPGDRRLFAEPRLRTARAQMHWTHTELLIGSETPLISDLNPISVAAVGIPGFVAAGNLWNWLPQIRLTQEILGSAKDGSPATFALQAAVLAPFTNSQHLAETDAVDAGERSGRPFVETRARLRWGATKDGTLSDGEMLGRGGEIGLSAHYGWARTSGTGMQNSKAIAGDAHVSLPGNLELRGEVYRGQLLRGLGGGGIGQNFGRAIDTASVGPLLRDTAGWLQLNAQLHPTFIAGVGCGMDAVDLRDRPVRQRNAACALHTLYRPNQPVFIAFEVRALQTRYADHNYRGTHFNLAIGFEL
ncbi:MAG: hypothetical protein ABI120_12365 [Gemmatimonadaceae bacterium]